MTRLIVSALVACVGISALGGFGAPLMCRGSSDDRCGEQWRAAAAGALAAGGTLGTLLAKLAGDDHQP